jgi:hypothetical protein
MDEDFSFDIYVLNMSLIHQKRYPGSFNKTIEYMKVRKMNNKIKRICISNTKITLKSVMQLYK